MELSAPPPINYNVYYAGWDRSGGVPDYQIGIHHPNGDLKKISTSNTPATKTVWGAPSAFVWRLTWDEGTTEIGSSGSPLFNQNGNIIGQLFGGNAACSANVSNFQPDYYGRTAVSWSGLDSSMRLWDWLNPYDSSLTSLDGYDPVIDSIDEETSLGDVSIYPNPSNGLFNLKLMNINKINIEVSAYDLLGKRIKDLNYSSVKQG